MIVKYDGYEIDTDLVGVMKKDELGNGHIWVSGTSFTFPPDSREYEQIRKAKIAKHYGQLYKQSMEVQA